MSTGSGAASGSGQAGNSGDGSSSPAGSSVIDNRRPDADLDDAQGSALGEESRDNKLGDIAKAEEIDKEHAAKEKESSKEKDGKSDPETKKDDVAEGKDVPKKWRGKTASELVATLKEQEKHQGKQSTELGELRKAIKDMAEQNKALYEKLAAGNNAPQPDSFEAAVARLETDVEDGKITPTEFTKQVAMLNQQKTEQIVQFALEQSNQKNAQLSADQQYLEMNPDFQDLNAQGVMDRIMQQYPAHDRVSAYEFYKRLEVEARAESLQSELAQLKKDQAASIAAGKEGAKKVLSKPGATQPATSAPNKNRKSLNEGAAVESMLNAMRRLRE